MLLTILSSVAQQEVENISSIVKMGLKMKMQRGELVGFQSCLGYDYDPVTKQISVNEEEAKIVRYIFERYISGVGAYVIAKELMEFGYKTKRGNPEWNDTTVLGIIKNEKYKGDLLQGKTFTLDPISKRRLENHGEEDQYYIKNHHEPIVSEEVFNKAQDILHRRGKKIAGSLNKAVNGKNTVGNSLLAASWNVRSVVPTSLGGVGIVVHRMKRQFGSVPLTRRREKDFVRTAKE